MMTNPAPQGEDDWGATATAIATIQLAYARSASDR